MTKDALREREKALENEFFAKKNKELVDEDACREGTGGGSNRLGACLRRDGRAPSRRSCSIMAIGADTLAALVLVPLVMVAWADRDMAYGERGGHSWRPPRSLGVEEGHGPP